MLLERTFAIGGALCVAFGALLFAVVVALAPELWPTLIGAALMAGFGIFFMFVGRDARRYRLELVAPPDRPDTLGPPPRRP